MSAEKNREKTAALSQLMAQTGAGLGMNSPMGAWNQNMGTMASNAAQAAAEKEAQKAAEKKKKGNFWSSVLKTVGGIGGSLIPGLGPILGPALGSAVGDMAGKAVTGNKVDLGSAAMSGLQGGVGGAMGGKLAGASKVVNAAQAPGALATPGLETAANAASGAAAKIGTGMDPAKAVQGMVDQGNAMNTIARAGGAAAVPAAQATLAASPMAGMDMGGGFLSKVMPQFMGQQMAGTFMGGMGMQPQQAQPTTEFVRDPLTGKLIPKQYGMGYK